MKQKRVVVTGGDGFLGKYLVKKFSDKGYKVSVPIREYFDLRRRERVRAMYASLKPDIVVHAAASCGGIQACSTNPGKFLYDNLIMNAEVVEGARVHGIEKFVGISSVCAYPLNVSLPAKEEDIWEGYPEETNAPYGIAKRVLISQCQSYRKQYGMNAISLVLANMYGPGDSFDPSRSHVIPSLIRKCIEASINSTDLVVWGTGKATREYLYVEDCAEAIVLATEKYDNEEPVNVVTGQEVPIENVVSIITSMLGYKGNIKWDSSKPEGQPRRWFDNTKAMQFGFESKTPLWKGIEKTIEWYKRTHV